MTMRLYSFVAGLYLSDLQKGLQTAHTVSEFAATYEAGTDQLAQVDKWACENKTIIILNALNHGGVMRAHAKLQETAAKLGLPVVLFREDEESMNNMATATAVVVPDKYYDAQRENDMIQVGWVNSYKYRWTNPYDRVITEYNPGTPEFDFIDMMKSYRLA